MRAIMRETADSSDLQPGSPAEAQAWPQPALRWAALWEAAGWAAVIAALTVLALAWAVAGLERRTAQQLQEARVALLALEVREQLEAEATLGLDLGESARAQAALDALIARDPFIRAAEVFDPSGRSLFSVDRGLVGEPVPVPWLQAARAASAQTGATAGAEAMAGRWQVSQGGDTVIGAPLLGAFGEVGGYLAVTVRPVLSAWTADRLALVVGLMGLASLAVLALTAWQWYQQARQGAAVGERLAQRLQGRVQATAEVLASVESLGQMDLQATARLELPVTPTGPHG